LLFGGSFFFKSEKKKKEKNPDERMNFAIFSYKIAMQIYFKSLNNCSKYAALSKK